MQNKLKYFVARCKLARKTWYHVFQGDNSPCGIQPMAPSIPKERLMDDKTPEDIDYTAILAIIG